MTIMNIDSRLRGVARAWKAGIGYRDFRTADLPEAKATEILDLVENEQERGRFLTHESGFPERPDLASVRTTDGGYVYYRARRVVRQAGINEPAGQAIEVVALWTPTPEWRDEVADRLDTLGLPLEGSAIPVWIPLGGTVRDDDKLFARLWIKGKGCKYYCRGLLSEVEADEITRLIVALQSGPRSRGDADRPAVLRLSNPSTRLFPLAVESADPDNPGRKVPEVLALITSDRNTWSREVGQRLKNLAVSLPRDEAGLSDDGWTPVTTTGRPARSRHHRRFSLRSLLGLNGS